ncbi:DUF397 domain-containing protein [Streptomyces sp. 891-h]|uniref:DUF397 domain-containing protein n=1 Tax=Streptomyces sp. 891-h TaxID=2720714 RepID=UPI001FAA09CD|nr:DUF397 domain-containing protein [Streptomyces sp. 891-h]UNZ18185.1 DUF397 domain-containing protein [Streptomyces sp. 891-h]
MTGYTRTDEKTGLTWRKSSYSGGDQGQCVEVAEAAGAIYVRDSKDPDGASLAFTPAEFNAFTQFASELDA